jgi:hypothetical protein
MYLPVVKKCFWENNKASCGRAKKEKGAVRIKYFKKIKISTMKSCSSAFHYHNKIPFGKKNLIPSKNVRKP